MVKHTPSPFLRYVSALIHPNKIPSYSAFDADLKPNEQKLRINATIDLHPDGQTRR